MWRTCLLWLTLACSPDEPSDPEPPAPSPDTAATATADVCAELGLTVRPWDEGPYATALDGVADDFTVATTAGDWSFREHFTGCEVVLFIPSVPAQEEGWPTPLWERDMKPLLEKLPLNTHVFFVSSADKKVDKDADVALIEDKIAARLAKLDDDEAAWWGERLHVVSQRLDLIDGWVGDYLRSPGFGFGIDRFQRIRDIGSFADGERYDGTMGWFEPNLSHAAHEAIHYNFESDRADRLDAQDVLVVPTFTGEVVQDPGWSGAKGYVDVTLPDAATLADYDTLELDFDLGCVGEGEFGTCPAWDRLVHLYACAASAEPEASIPAACEPAVAGTTDTSPVPAETLACACEEPDGSSSDGVRTCADDGASFGACVCPCDSEVGRWVTAYHRKGRWVSDASHALPWFADGGPRRLGFYTVDPYEIDIDFRFSRTGSPRPVQSHPLFRGGSFGPTYNDAYAPIAVEIPASATKVELVVLITGHGMESPGNCAEFCDTQHHFTVEGVEHLVSFPETADAQGCQDVVGDGTVPNQYGTWFYGRSNWCPGRQVDPIVFDITDEVAIGGTSTFTYSADYQGAPYPSGGASISLSSWVVVRE